MFTRSTRQILLSTAAGAAFLVSAPFVLAATNFDGTWVIDVPASTTIVGSSDSACPALRFPVKIEDGHIVATLARVPTRDGGVIVEAGTGTDSAAVSGVVQPDGTVNAQWEGYHAAGTLSGTTGVVTVSGECGPRTAQAVRVE